MSGARLQRDRPHQPGDVDLVLVATTSADEMSPHTAALVAGRLGAVGSGAVDVSAACTGLPPISAVRSISPATVQ